MENYISNVVELAFADSLSTDNTLEILSNELTQMSNGEFCELLEVTGYIPDTYPPDSSRETLFSKLIEQVVCEWSKRCGFQQSYLQTQKSSVEDITITDGMNVIVADAKTFRLGRSQTAPNVKDVIKQGDYRKWIQKHKNQTRLGGIVTFPHKFEWKTSNDVHSYLTGSSNPILLFYHYHLLAMIKFDISRQEILNFFANHQRYFPSIIPKSANPKNHYFSILKTHFFGTKRDEYLGYKEEVSLKIKRLKANAIQRLNSKITEIEQRISEEMDQHKTLIHREILHRKC